MIRAASTALGEYPVLLLRFSQHEIISPTTQEFQTRLEFWRIPCVSHSYLSATIGSTFVERRAGK